MFSNEKPMVWGYKQSGCVNFIFLIYDVETRLPESVWGGLNPEHTRALFTTYLSLPLPAVPKLSRPTVQTLGGYPQKHSN